MNRLGLSPEHLAIMDSVFARHLEVERVKVFGSRALGSFTARSDVDLVVYGKKIDRFVIGDMLLDFESSNLPYLVDLLNYDEIKNPELRRHMDRVAVDIYVRTPV
ncbi:MAG: nucleotidyltransferase domain-containing protein [Alphaproteobacteria bacterium]|nr:nucleotidyltransferase domain-containing protein [Alphaproteobacteria bacterium]